MKKMTAFTLIEVMIALAVFAVLATITSAAMYHAFNTRARVNVQADRLNDLQLMMSLIQRDTVQGVSRSIRGNDMHLFPAFVGQKNYVEFTRGGVANPNALAQRSTLKRVAYLCQRDKLIRRSWESVDDPARDHYQDFVLLANLEACSFAYLNQTRQILSEWHTQTGIQNQKDELIPTALQFNLNLRDWGNMSLLFIFPEALYVAQGKVYA